MLSCCKCWSKAKLALLQLKGRMHNNLRLQVTQVPLEEPAIMSLCRWKLVATHREAISSGGGTVSYSLVSGQWPTIV